MGCIPGNSTSPAATDKSAKIKHKDFIFASLTNGSVNKLIFTMEKTVFIYNQHEMHLFMHDTFRS